MGELLEKLGINWQSLIFQIINFVILLVILKKFVYKPVLHILAERKKKIAESIKKAEAIDQEEERASRERDEVIRQARTQAKEIVDRAYNEAESVHQEKLNTSKTEIEHLVAKSKEQIEQEKRQALHEVRLAASSLVIKASERVLRERLTDERDKTIVEESVKELLKS